MERSVFDSPLRGGAWFEGAEALIGGSARSASAPLLRPCCNHRTIFISDTHLGTRGCKAEALADFLAHYECGTLFLVGDIIDGWRLRKSWYWDEAHDEILRLFLKHAQKGTEVTYIPGNHDEIDRKSVV